MCSICVVLLMSTAPYSYVRYHFFNMGVNSYLLFSPCWFVSVIMSINRKKKIICSFIERRYPFDWKTPYGYLVAWLLQCVGSTTNGMIYVHFLYLVFGSSWFFIFIADDITMDMAAFNIDAKTETSNENHTELKKRFSDIVQVYLDAKQ